MPCREVIHSPHRSPSSVVEELLAVTVKKKKPRYFKLNQVARRTFDLVFDIREQHARTLDKPPNSVITNEQLFDVVERKRKVAEIEFGKTVPHRVRQGMRQEITETLPRIPDNPAGKNNHA